MLEKRLWREARKDKGLLIGTVFASLLNGALILGQAYLLANIVGKVFLGGQNLNQVWSLLFMLGAIMAVRAVVAWGEEWMALQLAHRVQGSLRSQLIRKIGKLGPVKMRDEQTGSIVTLVTEGIDTLEDYFARYLPQLFKCAILPVLFLVFIFPLDSITGWILLCTAPLVPFFMMLIGSWTNKLNEKQWGLLSKMSGYLQDVIQGLTTLKMLNRSKHQEQKIAQISDEFRVTTMKVLRVAFISALALELVTTLSIALVAVGLGLRLVEGQIEFTGAFFLILLAPDFYLPLRTLGSHFHASLNGIAAANQIYEFLSKEEWVKDQGGQSFDDEEIGIEFDQVSFAYGERTVLHNLSFTINPGERIALVGTSGGGKTTILNLIAGFLQPTAGVIRVNGKELPQLDNNQWREKLSFVSQKPYLFAGSVQQNLELGMDSIDQQEKEWIMGELGLNKVIAQLSNGEQTIIGSGGESLSGGQRQLLAMARAWLKHPSLMILDEATANMDVETEELVQQGLEKVLKGKTAIIAAHRLSTIEQADRIFVIHEGQVVEEGNHQQLLNQQGYYHQLIQAGGVNNE